MASTLVLTESKIDDSDLCLKRDFNSSKELILEESLSDDNYSNDEMVVPLDENQSEETELMKAFGLPIGFTSKWTTKRSNKRKKKKNKSKLQSTTCSQTDDLESINNSFEEYWTQSGDQIIEDSWNEFWTSSQRKSNEEMEETAQSEDVCTQMWQEHWFDVYTKAYNKFVEEFYNKSFEKQKSIQDKFEFLPKMFTNCKLSEECVDGSADEERPSADQTPTESHKSESKTYIGSRDSLSNSSATFITNDHNDSGSDGPPEERPTQIKRQHESDSLDLSEENRDKIETEVNSEFKVLKTRKKKRCKYWFQRYRLFSRFDEGIKLDDESWYSVTPERIAQHIANRFSQKNYHLIIDAFCGAGGNTIQFALISPFIKVIAIDIDEQKIGFAKHNAQIYGVDDRIEFIVADYMLFAKTCVCKVDAVFLSPPWGGPNYLKKTSYGLNMMTPDGADVFRVTNSYITPNIGFLLPRNIDTKELSQLAGEGKSVEIEQNRLNNKVKTVTAYFGNLIKSDT